MLSFARARWNSLGGIGKTTRGPDEISPDFTGAAAGPTVAKHRCPAALVRRNRLLGIFIHIVMFILYLAVSSLAVVVSTERQHSQISSQHIYHKIQSNTALIEKIHDKLSGGALKLSPQSVNETQVIIQEKLDKLAYGQRISLARGEIVESSNVFSFDVESLRRRHNVTGRTEYSMYQERFISREIPMTARIYVSKIQNNTCITFEFGCVANSNTTEDWPPKGHVEVDILAQYGITQLPSGIQSIPYAWIPSCSNSTDNYTLSELVDELSRRGAALNSGQIRYRLKHVGLQLEKKWW